MIRQAPTRSFSDFSRTSSPSSTTASGAVRGGRKRITLPRTPQERMIKPFAAALWTSDRVRFPAPPPPDGGRRAPGSSACSTPARRESTPSRRSRGSGGATRRVRPRCSCNLPASPPRVARSEPHVECAGCARLRGALAPPGCSHRDRAERTRRTSRRRRPEPRALAEPSSPPADGGPLESSAESRTGASQRTPTTGFSMASAA